MRYIWLGKPFADQIIVYLAKKFLTKLWYAQDIKRRRDTQGTGEGSDAKWLALSLGVSKCNIDAAIFDTSEEAGYDAVVRTQKVRYCLLS